MDSIPKILEWCKEERDEAKQEGEVSLEKLQAGSNTSTAGQLLDHLSQAIGRLNAFREVIAKLEDEKDDVKRVSLKPLDNGCDRLRLES